MTSQAHHRPHIPHNRQQISGNTPTTQATTCQPAPQPVPARPPNHAHQPLPLIRANKLNLKAGPPGQKVCRPRNASTRKTGGGNLRFCGWGWFRFLGVGGGFFSGWRGFGWKDGVGWRVNLRGCIGLILRLEGEVVNLGMVLFLICLFGSMFFLGLFVGKKRKANWMYAPEAQQTNPWTLRTNACSLPWKAYGAGNCFGSSGG